MDGIICQGPSNYSKTGGRRHQNSRQLAAGSEQWSEYKQFSFQTKGFKILRSPLLPGGAGGLLIGARPTDLALYQAFQNSNKHVLGDFQVSHLNFETLWVCPQLSQIRFWMCVILLSNQTQQHFEEQIILEESQTQSNLKWSKQKIFRPKCVFQFASWTI